MFFFFLITICIQIAHDAHLQWTTACEFIDDDTFICSEDGGNLISCHKNSGSTKEQERNILNELGLYHLGEQINVFQHGKYKILL
jgi:DNA damage-binding protein 1